MNAACGPFGRHAKARALGDDVEPRPRPLPRMPPPTLAPSRSAAIRVAVVEDDAACRQSLVQALQAAPDMQLAWQCAARAGGLGPAAAGRHRVHAVAAVGAQPTGRAGSVGLRPVRRAGTELTAQRQLPLASGLASYLSQPASTEPPPTRSFGCVLPSLTGTSAKSKGLMPSMHATLTPYSSGDERRR